MILLPIVFLSDLALIVVCIRLGMWTNMREGFALLSTPTDEQGGEQ